MVIHKSPCQIFLSDTRDFPGGEIDTRQTAWMLNTPHDVACYLGYADIAHDAITLNTYFVDLKDHTGAMLGSWCYVARAGQPLKNLPPETISVASSDVLTN